MSQAVPIVSERRGAEPFGQFAKRIHSASLNAYRYACFDPYTVKEIKEEVAAANGPIQPGFVFNFLPTRPVAEIAQAPESAGARSWSIQHEIPHRAVPAFNLQVRRAADLTLIGRGMWQGFDGPALDAFFVAIHSLHDGRIEMAGASNPLVDRLAVGFCAGRRMIISRVSGWPNCATAWATVPKLGLCRSMTMTSGVRTLQAAIALKPSLAALTW